MLGQCINFLIKFDFFQKIYHKTTRQRKKIRLKFFHGKSRRKKTLKNFGIRDNVKVEQKSGPKPRKFVNILDMLVSLTNNQKKKKKN